MALLKRKLGTSTGNVQQDVKLLYNYIAYLTEQLDYMDNQLGQRLEALEKGVKTSGSAEEG